MPIRRKGFTDYLEQENIPYKELDGCYKGNRELSYIINQKHYSKLRRLIRIYKQESVLLLDNYKHGLYKATLDYLDSDVKTYIGYLREAPKDYATRQDCYTYDKLQDKYFIVTESDTTTVEGLEKLFA